MRQDVITGQNQATNIDLSLYAVSWRIQARVIARQRSQDVHLQLRAGQNGSERRGKFTWRFVPPLAQLPASPRSRKLVKYGETYLFDIKAPGFIIHVKLPSGAST